MSKNNKSKQTKGASANWFKQQDALKEAAGKPKAVEPKTNQNAKHAEFRQIDDAPIIKLQMNSKKEEQHFEAAYRFALKESNPDSEEIMTVHLNMKDELVFNMEKNEAYQSLWEKGELMLLVAFPRNWRTMPLMAEPEEEDEEAYPLETDEEKFDYLFETGMAIYEGK